MLITLAIVGIVAAITIPTLTKNIQEAVLKNQFKKTYSLIKSTMLAIQTENGMPINCYYWDERPFACSPTCDDSEKNEYGNCTKWFCEETGKPLPPNVNGPFNDCRSFDNELFSKRLKVIKHCKNNALSNGCIPSDYKGVDKVKMEQDPDLKVDPNIVFGDTPLKTKYPAYVLADGSIIIRYAANFASPIYAFDINGSKGPNKWGYDLFAFLLKGNSKNGITQFVYSGAVEKGGKTLDQMRESVGIK